MDRKEVKDLYFKWLVSLICEDSSEYPSSFSKLLSYLYSRKFYYIVKNDKNRYEDGVGLRKRFIFDKSLPENNLRYLDGPCSILEMMVALALRCEETIMTDPEKPNRTPFWFWRMIVSLGLGKSTNHNYDEDYVKFVVDRFLKRKYSPTGKGGLFTLNKKGIDARKMEIWYQLTWYLNNFC